MIVYYIVVHYGILTPEACFLLSSPLLKMLMAGLSLSPRNGQMGQLAAVAKTALTVTMFIMIDGNSNSNSNSINNSRSNSSKNSVEVIIAKAIVIKVSGLVPIVP